MLQFALDIRENITDLFVGDDTSFDGRFFDDGRSEEFDILNDAIF
jgi:hypothetical protein